MYGLSFTNKYVWFVRLVSKGYLIFAVLFTANKGGWGGLHGCWAAGVAATTLELPSRCLFDQDSQRSQWWDELLCAQTWRVSLSPAKKQPIAQCQGQDRWPCRGEGVVGTRHKVSSARVILRSHPARHSTKSASRPDPRQFGVRPTLLTHLAACRTSAGAHRADPSPCCRPTCAR